LYMIFINKQTYNKYLFGIELILLVNIKVLLQYLFTR